MHIDCSFQICGCQAQHHWCPLLTSLQMLPWLWGSRVSLQPLQLASVLDAMQTRNYACLGQTRPGQAQHIWLTVCVQQRTKSVTELTEVHLFV